MALETADDPAVFVTRRVNHHCVVTTGSYDLLEASPDAMNRQVALFAETLGGLDCRFQVHVASRPVDRVGSTRPALSAFLEEAQRARPAYRREVALVLTAAPPPAARLVSRWGRSGSSPAASDPARAASRAVRTQAEAAVRGLALMGLAPALLEGHRLRRFLDERLPRCVARCSSDPWREEPGALSLDSTLSRGFILGGFPGVELQPGWLAQLLDTPAVYDLAVHGVRLPTASVLRLLGRRVRDLQASRLSDIASQSVGDPLVETGLPEALGLRRQVAANQEHLYAAGLYLCVHGASPRELDAATEAVMDRAARSMMPLLPATFQAAPAHLACLPLGEDPVAEERLLPGTAMASLYPWLWDELQQPGGHFIGRRIHGGSPVLVDTFDADRFANANVGVFGHSGAGKTFLMRGLLLSDADAGIGGFVIDPESEYRDVCEAIGGEWVDLALGSGTSVNVLDPALSAVGERDVIGDQVADLADLLGIMCGTLSEDERVDIDLALRQTLARPGQTLLDLRHLLRAGDHAPRVARSLRRWTEGPMGELFARPTNVAMDAEFVVFSLRDLKEEVLPVAYFLIAQWIWARVRSDPGRRRLLFDEVGLVFEHPPVRRFLVRLARRVRKYQGSLCLVTQNAGDLLSSDQGLVLATNPQVLFLGAQRQAEAQRLQRAYGLTDSQVAFLAGAGRGDFLVLAGERRHRVHVEANAWQLQLQRKEG